ncbi:decaprenylphospho-beta-D-ribofuranose 2-oxidase [Candidatus Magnetomoraceae bacterium gMMP-15]
MDIVICLDYLFMNFHSWGNYPKIKNRVFGFDQVLTRLEHIVRKYDELIPYGNGRSYGDSALNKNIIYVKQYNFFINFDETKGLLHIQSGVLLSEIVKVFVPRGWFLKITPGTKLITVGGAIASDVHGKNHHADGCFSECVEMFRLMLPDGEIVRCSRQENAELFKATCGGMGLTGVILDAEISLIKIRSKHIEQTSIKTKNLKKTFEAFEKYKDKRYSVAWLDGSAKGRDMGKSLLTVGDFSDDGELDYQSKKKLNIPFNFPSFVLNKASVKAFNSLYYQKIRDEISRQKVDIDTFFYPLDSLDNWNRIYGKKGFAQYQFILPKDRSYEGLEEILGKITDSSKSSFLAVLKLYGKANENYLSFPMEGYGLALDFKMEKGLFELFDKLDKTVLKHGGRIYLAKDVRMSKDTFEKGYPKIKTFKKLRKKYKMDDKFNSLQSYRVGL